jgi:hypothetical protein
LRPLTKIYRSQAFKDDKETNNPFNYSASAAYNFAASRLFPNKKDYYYDKGMEMADHTGSVVSTIVSIIYHVSKGFRCPSGILDTTFTLLSQPFSL